MTFGGNTSSKGQTQLNARVSEELKERFRDATESQGRSMTEVLEELVAQYVDETETLTGEARARKSGLDESDSRMLRKSLSVIYEQAAGRSRIPTQELEAKIATQVGIPQPAVRTAILKPLEQRGYIRPRWGSIEVLEGEA